MTKFVSSPDHWIWIIEHEIYVAGIYVRCLSPMNILVLGVYQKRGLTSTLAQVTVFDWQHHVDTWTNVDYWIYVIFTWKQFYGECPSYYSVKWVWKPYFCNCCHISVIRTTHEANKNYNVCACTCIRVPWWNILYNMNGLPYIRYIWKYEYACILSANKFVIRVTCQ